MKAKPTASTSSSRAARRGRGDVLSIVEAAYSIDLPFAEWAQGILRATNEIVVGGAYGFACTWRRSDGGGLHFERESAVSLGAPQEMLAAVLDGLTTATPEWVSEYLRYELGPTRCALTSEVDRAHDLKYRSELAARGIPDGVNLTATDLSNFGFLISFAVPMGYRLPPAVRFDLRRAATHILAALRLRRRLGASGGPTESRRGAPARLPEPEAVLSSKGEVLHAEGEAKLTQARRILGAAVRDIERARARKWERPQLGLERWKGLVSARWSLVDRFEEGGKRYVIARDNQPQVGGSVALTQTESTVVAHLARGCSTKETAYTLGMSATTVRVLLMRAARKCGANSRSELFRIWNAAGKSTSTD